ncbi:unnamed protein product [Chrysoparadoxa australica]
MGRAAALLALLLLVGAVSGGDEIVLSFDKAPPGEAISCVSEGTQIQLHFDPYPKVEGQLCLQVNNEKAACHEFLPADLQDLHLDFKEYRPGCHTLHGRWIEQEGSVREAVARYEAADPGLGRCFGACHVGLNPDPRSWCQDCSFIEGSGIQTYLTSPEAGDLISDESKLHVTYMIVVASEPATDDGQSLPDGTEWPKRELVEGMEVCCHLSYATGEGFSKHACSRDNNGLLRLGQLLPKGEYFVRVYLKQADGAVAAFSTAVPFTVTTEQEGALPDSHYQRKVGFRQIYSMHVWSKQGGRSGAGSTLEYSELDRSFMLRVLTTYSLGSMYDAGCGSMEWQPTLLEQYRQLHGRELRYRGADVVHELIERHQRELSTEHMSFAVADLATEQLDLGQYDVVLLRHVLFHNNNTAIRDILQLLKQAALATGQDRYMLATTVRVDPSEVECCMATSSYSALNGDGPGMDGRDMRIGGFRPVALELEPFGLPPPIAWSPEVLWADEYPGSKCGAQSGLGLWLLNSLPVA